MPPATVVDIQRALGAVGVLAHFGVQPSMCRHWLNIFVPSCEGVFHGMMVEDLTVFFAGANLPAAHPLG